MIVYVVPAMVGVALFTHLVFMRPPPDAPLKAQANAEMNRYRIFVSTADQFVKGMTPPATTTAYTWNDIKVSAGPAIQATGMRTDWKIVVTPARAWAACTQMNEITVAGLNKLYPPAVAASSPMSSQRIQASALTSGGGGALGVNAGVNSAVIGVGSASESLAAANLCDAV